MKGQNSKLVLQLREKLLNALNKLLDTCDPVDIPAATYSVINKIIQDANLTEEELDETAKKVLAANTDSNKLGITEDEIEQLRAELKLVK